MLDQTVPAGTIACCLFTQSHLTEKTILTLALGNGAGISFEDDLQF